LSDVLGRLFISRGWGRSSEAAALEAAWAAAIDPAEIPHCRAVGLRRGVLEIEVKSAVLLQEFAQFRKRELLGSIRAKLPGRTISDLRFRPGSW